eukprot:7468734-Pyramimonas_sp.AAC.1
MPRGLRDVQGSLEEANKHLDTTDDLLPLAFTLQEASRWPQDRPKKSPRRPQERPGAPQEWPRRSP